MSNLKVFTFENEKIGFLSKSNVNMKRKEKQAFLNGTSSVLLFQIYTQMPKHFEHLANVYKSDVN